MVDALQRDLEEQRQGLEQSGEQEAARLESLRQTLERTKEEGAQALADLEAQLESTQTEKLEAEAGHEAVQASLQTLQEELAAEREGRAVVADEHRAELDQLARDHQSTMEALKAEAAVAQEADRRLSRPLSKR